MSKRAKLSNMSEPIYVYFFGNENKYYSFSNFYMADFTDENNVKYICSEQYFMKKKQELFDPTNHDLAIKIMNSTNPKQIKKYGRLVKNFDESIWKINRYQIMLNGLRYKFSQNADIKELLLSTNDAIIAEASPYDKIWGLGISINDALNKKKWKGSNLLGNALMELRNELKV